MFSSTFSIITVVYNDMTHIQETMDSVINQSYKNIEYILIDGGSDDGSKETIHEIIALCATITHKEKTSDRLYLEATHKLYPTLTFKFLSERDKGIYDAMNKGIILASKEWINFMNCGDRFYDLNILQKVADLIPEEADVVYGDTYFLDSQSISIAKHTQKYRMSFCHQSVFLKTQIAKKNLFDTSYTICADNALFIHLYHSNFVFKKIDLIISAYANNGISSSLSWKLFLEDCKVGYKYNRLFPIYLALKWILWTIPKDKLKRLIIR